MSYILDALRRADAERQQGQVPGLHDATAVFVPTPASNPRAWFWWGAGAALMAVAALLGAWWWQAPALSGPQPPQSPAAADAGPQTPVVVTAVAPAAAPAVPAVVVPTPPVLPMVVSAVPVAPAPGPAPAPAPLPAPAPAPATAPPRATPVDTPAVPPAPKPVPLQSLNADQRRELPRLVVGGSVWSDNAANRFVILDGQMLREGDAVAGGLVLERILPKSAVLRWRGMRLELAL